ncbi:hypothetical protein [Vibrio owensii]|uniref:hypothetical protein n=1 Tax=Vibrio owensii TaxID=696485 RepID=UPI004068B2B0
MAAHRYARFKRKHKKVSLCIELTTILVPILSIAFVLRTESLTSCIMLALSCLFFLASALFFKQADKYYQHIGS